MLNYTSGKQVARIGEPTHASDEKNKLSEEIQIPFTEHLPKLCASFACREKVDTKNCWVISNLRATREC